MKIKFITQAVDSALWERYKDKITFGPTPMAPAPPQYSVPYQISRLTDAPGKVFRFFEKPEHAEDFAKGKIWISTLERCRQYEDPKQGDKDEATFTHYVDEVVITDGRETKNQMLAARMGIKIPSSPINLTVKNSIFYFRLPDGLVLCTTLRYAPDTLSDNFGKHCVEISRPEEFFRTLTESLLSTYPMIEDAACGPISYTDRVSPVHNALPNQIGFIKPSDPYADQEEYRMLWLVKHDVSLTPGVIYNPALANYCKRIA